MTNIIKHRNDMPHKRSSWCDVDGVIHMSSSWRRTQWKASMWSLAIVHEVVHLCRKKKKTEQPVFQMTKQWKTQQPCINSTYRNKDQRTKMV